MRITVTKALLAALPLSGLLLLPLVVSAGEGWEHRRGHGHHERWGEGYHHRARGHHREYEHGQHNSWRGRHAENEYYGRRWQGQHHHE